MELYLQVKRNILDIELEWKSINPVDTTETLAQYLEKVHRIFPRKAQLKRRDLMFLANRAYPLGWLP